MLKLFVRICSKIFHIFHNASIMRLCHFKLVWKLQIVPPGWGLHSWSHVPSGDCHPQSAPCLSWTPSGDSTLLPLPPICKCASPLEPESELPTEVRKSWGSWCRAGGDGGDLSTHWGVLTTAWVWQSSSACHLLHILSMLPPWPGIFPLLPSPALPPCFLL